MLRTTLISTEELAAQLANPTVVIVDCRFDLADTSSGRRQYEASHVPGAVYADLDIDLAGEKDGSNGRHPLPDPSQLRRVLDRLGIEHGKQVIVYDQDTGMYASRLWWLLRWMGFGAAAVLDGGFAKWTRENRAVKSGVEGNTPGNFVGSPDAGAYVDADAVMQRMTSDEGCLLDARAPERYRGETEPLDRVAGHIPGALNHFYKNNLDPDGTFKSPEELRRLLGDATGHTSPDQVICYCGSGVTACHNLLALEHAGLGGARLYAGSWSEWSSDPSRPIEVGEQRRP